MKKWAVGLLEAGKTATEVQKLLQNYAYESVPAVRTIRSWKQQFSKAPQKVIKGRPKVYGEDLDQKIERIMRTAPQGMTSRAILQRLRDLHGLSPSMSYINKKNKKNQKIGCAEPKRQKSVFLKKHRQQRKAFAKFHTGTSWETVYFTDEKNFSLDGGDVNKVHYLLSRGRPTVAKKIGRKGVHCCMVLNSDPEKCRLHVQDTHYTQRAYATFIKDAIPYFHRVVHDNAKIHKAAEVRSVFETKSLRDLQLPPYSCDLNVVENAWSLLARIVYARKCAYVSKEELKTAILESWEELKARDNYFNKLVSSMEKRCEGVIKANGDYCNY